MAVLFSRIVSAAVPVTCGRLVHVLDLDGHADRVVDRGARRAVAGLAVVDGDADRQARCPLVVERDLRLQLPGCRVDVEVGGAAGQRVGARVALVVAGRDGLADVHAGRGVLGHAAPTRLGAGGSQRGR